MKKKVTLVVLALGLLMLFAAAAPAFALPSKCISFTVYVIAPANPSVPGTIIPTNNGEIGVGTGSIDHEYSTLLGTFVAYEKDWWYLNTNPSSPAYLTGSGVATSVSSNFVEHDAYTFNGLGPYTYYGPTITDGISTITNGEPLYGVLLSGVGMIQFTSGPYAGETAVGTWSGVSVFLPEGLTYVGSGTFYMH